MLAPDPAAHLAAEEYDEWDEHTRFEYFVDIEYDSDGYNDDDDPGTRNSSRKTSKGDVGHVQSNGTTSTIPSYVKTAKLPPVLLWQNHPFEPKEIPSDVVTEPRELDQWALPGWTYFWDLYDEKRSTVGAEDDDMSEDEDEDKLDGAEEPTMDLKALKIALQQNLASIGLDHSAIDEDMLLNLATSMMSKDDAAEEMLGKLIEDVHGKEEEDQQDPFSNWVASTANSAVNSKKRRLDPDDAVPGAEDDERLLKRPKNVAEKDGSSK
jgi:hypothetical protein